MRKSKTIQVYVDKLSKNLFGEGLSQSLRDRTCVNCGKKILGFRDKLSEREYEISGFCQECQDEIFGK